MSIGLSLDLSSPTGTFCIFEGANSFKLRSEVTLPGKFSHSETLLSELKKELFKNSLSIEDIDCWVLGCGPGSFTGLRIAYATVKAFSLASSGKVLTVEGPEARAFGFIHELGHENKSAAVAVLSHLTSEKVTVTHFDFENGALKKKSEAIAVGSSLVLDENLIVLSEERITKERLNYSGGQLHNFPLSARHLRFGEKLKTCRLLTPQDIQSASPLYFGSSHFD